MWIILLIIVIIIIYMFWNRAEYSADPPIRIRRWRSSVSNNMPGEPRQVQDDWWDKSYNSGIGFQLG